MQHTVFHVQSSALVVLNDSLSTVLDSLSFTETGLESALCTPTEDVFFFLPLPGLVNVEEREIAAAPVGHRQ